MTCDGSLSGDVVTISKALPASDVERGVDEQILNLSELRGLGEHAAVVASFHPRKERREEEPVGCRGTGVCG